MLIMLGRGLINIKLFRISLCHGKRALIQELLETEISSEERKI
jgi:hypothetical protein